ncbi:unnamed protein product [Leptidea sinapis]|uniref:Uncharacterized protein n=1 Tax=Leptidea sinapis TaxID=189913 RepID=A0A5E4Q1Q1_9NEOP|nr:unnamed protein product [Leptidea sinapis]
MRDDTPPAASAPRKPSRLKRTLRTLSSPFRSGSPFHIASLKRSGSVKSSVSDGDIVRDERTMRKKNKKQRADAPSTSRSTDSSPVVAKPKLGAAGLADKRVASVDTIRSESIEFKSDAENEPQTSVIIKTENSDSKTETETENQTIPKVASSSNLDSKSPEISSTPEPPLSPITVEHPVAMRAFAKATWKRRTAPEIQKPVEEPSPESAMKRRIAFVSQTSIYKSEEQDDEEGSTGEVGSLEEVIKVALARERLAASAREPSPPQSRDNVESEEEGDTAADTMPAYGDLIEPQSKPTNGNGPVSRAASVPCRV